MKLVFFDVLVILELFVYIFYRSRSEHNVAVLNDDVLVYSFNIPAVSYKGHTSMLAVKRSICSSF